MSVKLLAEHNLEFLSLTGGCTGSPESTLVKMPHCWKSHVAAHLYVLNSCIGNQTVKAQVFTKTVSAHLHLSKTFPENNNKNYLFVSECELIVLNLYFLLGVFLYSTIV